jgi:site-specific DNA recombinase
MTATTPGPRTGSAQSGVQSEGGSTDTAGELVQRLLKGRRRGARAGLHLAGTAPLGYCRGERAGTLQVDAREAGLVREIFQLYLETRSLKRTQDALARRGWRTRRGKAFSRAALSWILRNEAYIGRVRFGDIRARGEHKPIVERRDFRRVQRLLRSNNKRAGVERRTAGLSR